jgi:hypothetical protein
MSLLIIKNIIFLLSSASTSVFLVNLCIFSSVAAVLLISFVFVNRKYSLMSKSKDVKIKELTDNFITDLLFSDYETAQAIPQYKYLFKNKARKQVLIEEIIKLHDSLQGEEAQKLEGFYNESGLIKQSYSKVLSTNKDLVLSGLAELVEMKSEGYLETLEKLLKSTFDTELKKYLITAILKLDPKRGLDLILNADHFLSDWFQLIVLKEIDELGFTDFPALEIWNEKSESVALFGQRLYSYKNPLENSQFTEFEPLNIIEVAEDGTPQQAIFKASSLEQALIDIYIDESEETQQEIRNTLALLKSKIILPEIRPKTLDKARKRLSSGLMLQRLKNAFKPDKKIGLYFLDWKNRIKPKN